MPFLSNQATFVMSFDIRLRLLFIELYIIIRVPSAFSLVASCVLLEYTRTDDVN